MILILSNKNDTVTDRVINWLTFLEKDWFRINSEDNVKIEFKGDDFSITVEDKSINLSNIKGYWYRRGFINYSNNFKMNLKQFDDLQANEMGIFIDFLYYKLEKLNHINSITNSEVNKLIVNDIARSLNIITPDDFIVSDVNNLRDAMSKTNQKYITKVSSGNCVQVFDDCIVYNYATLIDNDKLNYETFFPSLVQNYIPKKYELRSFYLDGEFFTMAIFSQKDNQTRVDFRNYNSSIPNRTVPVNLPSEITSSLDKLMRKLNLNCGSLDLILTPDNDYVFLEVNPIGQFGMISYPCNYNLEKKIAEYL